MRSLKKNPGFTTVAVLSLALGIGANVAIFSIYSSFFLSPPPLAEPDRLVEIYTNDSADSDDFTIIGVAQEEFTGLYPLVVNVWYPITLTPLITPGSSLLESRGSRQLLIKGRLKDGVTFEQAGSDRRDRRDRTGLVGNPAPVGLPASYSFPHGDRYRDERSGFPVRTISVSDNGCCFRPPACFRRPLPSQSG